MTKYFLLEALVGLAALATAPSSSYLAAAATTNDDPLALAVHNGSYVCIDPPYKIHIVSRSPSVIYISNFLTPDERLHLEAITKDTFADSRVQSEQVNVDGGRVHDVRISQSTTVSSSDPVVACIEARALAFQGMILPSSSSSSSSLVPDSAGGSRSRLEPLQLVKYGRGGHYHFHTDWFTSPEHHAPSVGGNRISSFFAYVKVRGVAGGGTGFPVLEPLAQGEGGRGYADPADRDGWCELVDCDDEYVNGVTFRPVEGNAVYWENLNADGSGDQRTLHAGLPVLSGEKIGMNIWTRQGPLVDEIRG